MRLSLKRQNPAGGDQRGYLGAFLKTVGTISRTNRPNREGRADGLTRGVKVLWLRIQ